MSLLQEALTKLSSARVCPVEKALVAYSGGLDSILCVELIKRVYGARDVQLVLFDVGQGKAEIQKALEWATRIGASYPRVIDLNSQLYGDWIPRAICANASYRGYPIAAPIVKQLIARNLAKEVQDPTIAIVEGSTGLGTDQFRLSTPLKYFQPNVRVITPVRDLNLSRPEEVALAEHFGLPFADETILPGGDDKTAWCRSLGSGAITLDTKLSAAAWQWWHDPVAREGTVAESTVVTLDFQDGAPVALNGTPLGLRELVDVLNPQAGELGIGRVDSIEDEILGLKSRELYEAPAATLILAAHRELEHLCLTTEELRFKASIDARWLELVYSAHMFHPLVAALNAFILQTQQVVHGSVALRLFSGGFRVESRSAPGNLFTPKLRGLYGSTLDQRKLEGAVFAHGIPYSVLRIREDGLQAQKMNSESR